MEKETVRNDAVLMLSDENQRLVNINLLGKIKAHKPGGIKDIYDKLDVSLKRADLLNYDGMRKAIQRDLRGLSNSSGNPNELNRWLKRKKGKEKYLQIRLTADLFLLNNILVLLGIRFEELFDKNNLPGIAETAVVDVETPETGEDSKKDSLLLKEINAKLDTIIDKYAGRRIRKTYTDRFADFNKYAFFIKELIFAPCFEPEQFGFSRKPENDPKSERAAAEIYGHNFIFLYKCMETMVNKKFLIHKLFLKFQQNQYTNIDFKRMLSSFFMLGILNQMLINFTRTGVKTKKPIFHIREDNFYKSIFKDKTHDNEIFLESITNAQEKTLDFIKHSLDSQIIPDYGFCTKCELLFVGYLKNTTALFTSIIPLYDMFQRAFSYSNANQMESEIKKLLTPGFFFSFSIRKEQLSYLEEYVNKIEEIQFELGQYYVGNVDAGNVDSCNVYIEQSGATKIGYTPS